MCTCKCGISGFFSSLHYYQCFKSYASWHTEPKRVSKNVWQPNEWMNEFILSLRRSTVCNRVFAWYSFHSNTLWISWMTGAIELQSNRNFYNIHTFFFSIRNFFFFRYHFIDKRSSYLIGEDAPALLHCYMYLQLQYWRFVLSIAHDLWFNIFVENKFLGFTCNERERANIEKRH